MRHKEGDKKADLISAGLKIFAKKGFAQSKISDVTKEAKMATGTFYLYFASKDELLFQLFDGIWESLYQRLSLIKSNHPRQNFRDNLHEMIKFMLENPDSARLYINEYNQLLNNYPEGHPGALKCLKLNTDLIQEAFEQGFIYSYSTHTHVVLFGALKGVLEFLIRSSQMSEQIVEELLDILERIYLKEAQ